MIYLFSGTHTEKVRAKAFEWVAKAREKEPNLAYVRLAREELAGSVLEEAATSGSLFAKRTLTLLDDPFPSARMSTDEDDTEALDTGSVLDGYLDLLAQSENVIVILAPKLAAAKAKKLAGKATHTYTFDAPAARVLARGFNSNLVNALAAKSREKLWTELVRAGRAGDAPEMLHGLLHWKARDLLEKGSRAWNPDEARSLSLALIALLQESRRGSLDLSTALERFALSL